MPDHQLCTAPIVGGDGNIYSVVGTCRDALRKCGYRAEADELVKRILVDHEASSYDEALVICTEYCDPVGAMEQPRKLDAFDGPEDPEDDYEPDEDDYADDEDDPCDDPDLGEDDDDFDDDEDDWDEDDDEGFEPDDDAD